MRRWKLLGEARSIKRSRNCQQLLAAYKVGAAVAAGGSVWLVVLVAVAVAVLLTVA